MEQLPTVTVIMPIRNEGGFIARSLGAVLGQEYPSHLLEVIVADGMSTDETREMVYAFQRSNPNLRLVDNPGMIAPTAMNEGIRQAGGKVIVRVDGHTIISPDYVRKCVEALKRTGAENVGGRMDAVSTGSFGRAVSLATSSRFGVGGARFHYSVREEWVDTVYMGSWPREVFQRIGLFDEEQVRNQDDEFNYRLLEHGGRILLSPQIKSKYYNRSSLRSLWRQYFQYGYWKVPVMQKHPRQMRPRQLVPPAFVAVLLFACILSPFAQAVRWVALGVLGVYLLANLAASLHSVRRGGWASLWLMPVTFGTLHFAYGAGFLVGMIKFWNGWRDRVTVWVRRDSPEKGWTKLERAEESSTYRGRT